jgi:hypothetical protein
MERQYFVCRMMQMITGGNFLGPTIQMSMTLRSSHFGKSYGLMPQFSNWPTYLPVAPLGARRETLRGNVRLSRQTPNVKDRGNYVVRAA